MATPPDDMPDWVRTAAAAHAGRLTAYARRLLGDPGRAADVVQETFLRLCRQPPGDIGTLVPWLFAVCRSRALDVRRKEKRMTLITDEAIDARPTLTLGPAAMAERSDAAAHVARLLATLPSNQRDVLRLKFQHEQTYRQIADATGLSESNVGFLIHTGLKALRAAMTRPDDA